MRQRPWMAAMGTCALVALGAADARAQSCVSEETRAEVTSCHGYTRVAVRRPGAAPSSLGEAGPPEGAPSDATTAPGLDMRVPSPLDRPEGRRRETELLSRERAILERVRGRSRRATPQRARVLGRLEMTCAEQIQAFEREAFVLEEQIFQARRRAPARAAALTRRQRTAREGATEARQCAIRALAELVRDHPNQPELDRSLFALAYHLEQIRQHARARQVYHRLIRDFPQSEYVPQAYLAFAEHYFAEGELEPARQFYERVVSIPPERNPVYGYARYKLGWVRYNQDDFRGALDEFVAVLEHTRDYADRTSSAALARQVRRELVLPYAQVGRPDRALPFFRRVAADEDEAYEMLEALAALYHDTGQWPLSVRVHHRLMADRSTSDRVCRWQARVLDATVASAPKPAQVREAARLVDLRATFASSDHPATEVSRCDEAAATSLVLLATAWHREAVGTDDAPGTRDAETMDHAAELYDLLLTRGPALEGLSLPRIDRRDRPSTAQLALFRAELLFERGRFADAAEAYQRVLASEPDAELAANAAYGAVLAYDRVLGSREPPAAPEDRRLSTRELTDVERRMADTFRRFACVAPEHEDLPVVLYRWARLYYTANQFARASVLFRHVAVDHPTSEVGSYAANLYLDSLDVLTERRGRAACAIALHESLPALEEPYCRDPGARASNGELCANLVAHRCGLAERRAAAMSQEGEEAAAARLLLATVRAERCEASPRMLYNAALYFEAARFLGRTIRVRRALARSFPEHPLARRAVYLIGANYHALAIYGEAADHYERYASLDGRCDPGASDEPCPDAAEGLRHAVLFRLGLGQTEQALDDARTFERLFRRTRPRLTAEVVFAIGALYERGEAWPRMVEHYRGFVRRYARHATPTQLARAHALIARGWIRQGRRDRAARSLEAAVAIHERGGEAALAAVEQTPEEAGVELARLRDAVAEARYELAETERERFEAVRFPTLRGGASIARVERWALEELRPWIAAKLELLRAAEAAYGEVAPLGIPRWRIAAASRLGDMYLSLVEQVRGSPIPEVIERDDELYDIYVRAIDEAVEPFVGVASARYQHCLETATTVRWFDERSRRCERALNRLDAVGFPIAAELRGEPSYQPRDPARPGPPALDRPEDDVSG